MTVVEQGSIAKGITYGGVGATFFGWFTVTEWAAIAGVSATLIGMFLQYLSWLRKRDLDRTEKRCKLEEHEIRMEIHRAELERLKDMEGSEK